MEKISLECVVAAAKDQVSTNLEDEAVILNLKDGVYFGLNQVGARIWNCLQAPITIAQIRDTILKEYDVDQQRCEQDLLKLLKDLNTRGLIDIKDGKAA